MYFVRVLGYRGELDKWFDNKPDALQYAESHSAIAHTTVFFNSEAIAHFDNRWTGKYK